MKWLEGAWIGRLGEWDLEVNQFVNHLGVLGFVFDDIDNMENIKFFALGYRQKEEIWI